MSKHLIPVGTVLLLVVSLLAMSCNQGPPPEPFTMTWNYDTNGFLETCGCSAHQLGGIARRSTLLEGLREQQPLLALEGAHFIESDGEFQFFKGETVVELLNMMEYDAMQLGIREAQHGVEGINTIIGKAQFPCFSGNLTVNGEPLENQYVVIEIANNSVAILGVSQPEAANFELPEGIAFTDPVAAVDTCIAEIDGQADLIVLCLEGERTWIRGIAQDYSEDVNLFLAGDRNKTTASVEFNADPPALNNWDNGRYVGVISVDPLPDSYQITATSVKLDESYDDAPEIKTYLDDTYRPQLKDRFFGTMKLDLEQIYLPPISCEPCHYEEYRAYTASGHSHALDTLHKINQLYNPDCMSCHVIYDAKLDKLHAMNCVICHTNITDQHIWDAVEDESKIKPPEVPVARHDYEFCAVCHNEIQSNEFKAHWPQYVNKIYHGGNMDAAIEAAEKMGIDINEPPPVHVPPGGMVETTGVGELTDAEVPEDPEGPAGH